MKRCKPMLLMLEDDAERLVRFQAVLRTLNPQFPLRVWRDAHAMIREAGPLLPSATLISLDHDLVPKPDEADPGDGYMVAQWLAAQPVVRPVIVHSSNRERSTWMAGAFDLAGWSHHRVAPLGDDWIEVDWKRVVRRLLGKSRVPEGKRMATDLVKLSKFLSLVLRHKPEEIGLTLDANGWADVDNLLRLANAAGRRIDWALLEQVVAESDKKRFAFSDDGLRIRASQGHSVEVDLALAPAVPPEVLFHGTATRFLESIRATGLNSGSRQHVHLSLDADTAAKVGARHGKPSILTVRSRDMAAAGHRFYLSANGVWLTGEVPTVYIEFPV